MTDPTRPSLATSVEDERIVPSSTVVVTTEHGGSIVVPNVGVPTQIANPSRASWRTFVQAIIPTLIALNVALPIVQSFLEDNVEGAASVLGPAYPYVVLVVNFAALALGLAAKLLALLMANPGVNVWVERYLPFLAPIKAIER